MGISPASKEKILDGLMERRRAAQRLEIRLRFEGRADEADAVRRAARQLGREIDRLLAAAMEEWSGHSTSLIRAVERDNARLAEAIEALRGDVERGERLVEVLSLIEEGARLAASLLLVA